MVLKDKTALITGASDGIGKAIAFALSREVKELVLFGRDRKKLKKVASWCKDEGAEKVSTYAIDFLKKELLEERLDDIRRQHNNVSILINNAGVWQRAGSLDSVTLDKIEEIIRVNLISPIKITKMFLPILRAQPEAYIVNIISKSGIKVQKGQSVYTASKFGLRGFTEVLQEDLKDSNVKVVGVYQSGTKTNFFKKAGEEISPDRFNTYIEPEELALLFVNLMKSSDSLWVSDITVNHS